MSGKHRFEELSSRIIGAAIEVHKALGSGFLEAIYENAMQIELSRKNIRFESQSEIMVFYLGEPVGKHRLDLVVENRIIVELKAVKELTDFHYAQLRSYLMASGMKTGLLINFAKPTIEIKRIVN